MASMRELLDLVDVSADDRGAVADAKVKDGTLERTLRVTYHHTTKTLTIECEEGDQDLAAWVGDQDDVQNAMVEQYMHARDWRRSLS